MPKFEPSHAFSTQGCGNDHPFEGWNKPVLPVKPVVPVKPVPPVAPVKPVPPVLPVPPVAPDTPAVAWWQSSALQYLGFHKACPL